MSLNSLSPAMSLALLLAMVACELLFLALPALLWALIGKQPLRDAFAWRATAGQELLGAALLGLGFLPWVQTLVVAQNHLWPRGMAGQGDSAAFMLPLVLRYPVLMILAVPLSAAVSEELFFRGVLQRALLKRLPVWLAVGVGALLFAAMHFDLQGAFVRTLLGVLLGVLVLRGRTIFPAMTLHFVYDAAALAGGYWDARTLGIAHALRLGARADMGVGRTELLWGPALGTLLMLAGWGLCAWAWRRRPPPLAPLPTADQAADIEATWPPPPTGGVP